jgi:hypothetical protein
MSLNLLKLTSDHEDAYEDLLQDCRWSMLYHSLTYRRFLIDFLPADAQDCYLLAFNKSKLVGALPCFMIDGPVGPVINSLPFYGSHGSVLTRPGANRDISEFLIQGLANFCLKRKVSFSTVIDTPFSSNEKLLKEKMNFQFRDYRIGQVTHLPPAEDLEITERKLLDSYHQKTRNAVRKGLRSGLVFCSDQSEEALEAIHLLHKANILSIGGIPKPRGFFDAISRQMQYDVDYRIYYAQTVSGDIVCALMLLYFKDTVEYFVPATAEAWRSSQALSALIHIAMVEAVRDRNAKIWNWGGTWPTQIGVKQFKSRWGTQEYPYNYYTSVFKNINTLRELSSKSLLSGYPWFYTIPFAVLEE